MYIIIKNLENNNYEHFSMLSYNGIFVDENLQKTVIFPTLELANKQREVIAALSPDDTFVVKQIVLQDI